MARPVNLWFRPQPAAKPIRAPQPQAPTVLALPSVAPLDADIPTGSVAVWFDQIGHKVMFRAKAHDGTLTTGTVTLV